MNCIKTKYRQETEKELCEILGMSIDEFMALFDNVEETIEKEKRILNDAEYLDSLTKGLEREVMP